MPFLEVSFQTAAADAPRAEAACLAAGALAVTLSSAQEAPVLEPAPGEIRLWAATRVQALFAAAADPHCLRAILCRELGLASAQLDCAPLADRVWEREWLRDFHAQRFGQRLWICPHHESVAQPGAVVVRLDPGLAFGTGNHPSTALCLEWLDARLRPGVQVIDYGCGSGILALAAAKLGAAHVACFDIDPQARLATTQNAVANDCDSRCLSVCEQALALPAVTDVLLANILAGTLCALAGQFAQRVSPGGRVLLAGILADQVDVVTAVYSPWFDIGLAGQRAEWVALSGVRK